MNFDHGDIETEFAGVHNAFLGRWDQAMRTGITADLEEFYGADYFVIFLERSQGKPSIEDRTSALEGMRQSVAALCGGVKRFEHRIIRARNTQDITVFYEEVIERNDVELARLFTIEDWILGEHGWRIQRETVEVV